MKLIAFALLVAAAAAAPASDVDANHSPNRLPRVVGGQTARPHQFPWQVTLQIFGSHICGAAVLNERWVLTAAHCTGMMPKKLEVIAGKHDLGKKESTEQRSLIKRIINHKSYGGGEGPYDIALLELETPFKLNKEVQCVRLGTPEEDQSGSAVLSGWGSTSPTASSVMPNLLQFVELQLMTHGQCEESLGGPGASPLDPLNLCALNKGKAACSGDSGGPIVKTIGKCNAILGVVSWGAYPCTGDLPSVFTRVSSFRDWIAEQTKGDFECPC